MRVLVFVLALSLVPIFAGCHVHGKGKSIKIIVPPGKVKVKKIPPGQMKKRKAFPGESGSVERSGQR